MRNWNAGARVTRMPLALLLATAAADAYPASEPAETSASPLPVSTCGQVLSVPGDYHLVSDVGPCASDGLFITASDVHLSLDGFTLTGPGGCAAFPFGIRVHPDAANVRIDGGVVTRFTGGLYVAGAYAVVKGVTVTDNCYVGIAAVGNHDLIASNLVRGSSLGIALLGPDETAQTANTVYANHIVGNGRCGVCAFSNGDFVRGNTLADNGVHDQPGEGGIVVQGRLNRIRGNIVFGNFDGISLAGSSDGTYLRNNTANANRNAGVAITAGSTSNMVLENHALANGTVDVWDGNPCGANTWQANVFGTDSVDGVPDSGRTGGCLR
jgi:parallel beta-helix repeat protein